MKEKICSLFCFSGRVARLRYFFGAVIMPILLIIVVGLLGGLTDQINAIQTPYIAYPVAILYLIVVFGLLLSAIIIPISFQVRRLHDLDHSGWWFFLSFGLGIALLFWRGTKGVNSFGQDPLPVQK